MKTRQQALDEERRECLAQLDRVQQRLAAINTETKAMRLASLASWERCFVAACRNRLAPDLYVELKAEADQMAKGNTP